MKRSACLILSLLFISFLSVENIKAQVVYETVASGIWSDVNIWRSWSSGQIGVGASVSPTPGFPSGSNKVVIHTGDTVEMGGSRGCRSLLVEAGARLWANTPNYPSRLQVCSGGTGYPYPINDTIKVDGSLGGPTDQLVIEPGPNACNVTITGSGSIDLLRIRIPGGLAGNAANGGVLNMIFDADINLYQHDNYALTAVYNAAGTDNYSMTINPGKTIRLMDTSGYWHNNKPPYDSVDGNYTYNILGTLDLSINNQLRLNKKFSASILAPQGIHSHITVNIDGGLLKTGKVFIADTSESLLDRLVVSTGILKLRMVNGGRFDASAAQNCVIGHTSDGAGGYYPLIWASSRGLIRQPVIDSVTLFPIGSASTDHGNQVELINAGIEDVFAVAIQDDFDHVLDAPSQVINRQWKIDEAVPGGSNVTMRLYWLTSDEGSAVSHAQGSTFNIMHWNGSSWDYLPAIVTGSGTINDPYVAEATGITSFSPFGVVSNYPSVPVPVLFTDIKAWKINGAVQLEFVNATELNVKNYEVQRSGDGHSFASFTTVEPSDNSGMRSRYDCKDASPYDGNNYYRIRATDKNGGTFYSPVIKINTSSIKQGVDIFPVPLTGNTLNISLQDLAPGSYSVHIINGIGQQVYSDKISYAGYPVSQLFHLPNVVQKGIYILQLTNGTTTINKNLIIQ